MVEAIKTRKVIRLTVDLSVNDDNWQEKVDQGCTEKFLLGEVKQSFYTPMGSLWDDAEVQNAELVEVAA